MVICDIDGTICIGHYLLKAYCSKCEDFTKPECWRRQDRENCDWARMDWDFFVDEDLIRNDEEIPRSKKVLQALHEAGHAIVYVTGRESRLERPTVAWLEKHGYPPTQPGHKGHYVVYMRATGDARPIAEVKRDIVSRLLADMAAGKVVRAPAPKEPLIAFENNPTTREAYEKGGVRFFQAPECWKDAEHLRDLLHKGAAHHGHNGR